MYIQNKGYVLRRFLYSGRFFSVMHHYQHLKVICVTYCLATFFLSNHSLVNCLALIQVPPANSALYSSRPLVGIWCKGSKGIMTQISIFCITLPQGCSILFHAQVYNHAARSHRTAASEWATPKTRPCLEEKINERVKWPPVATSPHLHCCDSHF